MTGRRVVPPAGFRSARVFAMIEALTMPAAESFDPRIIWDVIEEDS